MVSAIIQARMTSSRLPKKVMLRVKGKPLIYYLVNQIKNSKKLTKIIIATTTNKEDDEIVEYIKSLNIDVFRGSESDVLDRYYKCAQFYNEKIIVRITSDCPLIDPIVIDECIQKFEDGNFDYVSNINKKIEDKWMYHPSGFPMGYAVEVFNFDALKKSWQNAKKPSEREHVTQYILNNPMTFQIGNVEHSEDYSDIRLTVDHKIDYDLIKIIMEALDMHKRVVHLDEIIKFLDDNPELKKINAHIRYDEGFLKSLENDKKSSTTNY